MQQKERTATFRLRFFGSGRRIRTLTYGVRVRCATFTQSRCVLTNKNYYTDFTAFVNSFFGRSEIYLHPGIWRDIPGYTRGSTGCGGQCAARPQRRKTHLVRRGPSGYGALDASEDGIRVEQDGGVKQLRQCVYYICMGRTFPRRLR